MKMMRIKMTICFPMLDGETNDQAVDRLIERIDPNEDATMSWNDSDIRILDDDLDGEDDKEQEAQDG